MQEVGKRKLLVGTVRAQTVTTTPTIDQAALEAKKTLRKGNVIITGASSGLGLATAKALAETGKWHIIMACRNFLKAERAAKSAGIAKESYTVMHLDLASLDSVRQFSENFRRSGRPLDVLVCNAAVYLPTAKEPSFTAEGFELSVGTNHLGHFLLSRLLLDDMKQSDYTSKRVIIVGAGTSAHDLAYELTENGCQVTMIQRSATHVMSVEKSVRTLFKSRELTGRKGGLPIDIVDQAFFLKQPYPVEYELLPRGQRIARELDQDMLDALKKVGYRLQDGYHGGGAYSMFLFDQGGFYWDTGCCKLIAEKKIQLLHEEIDYFTNDGVVYKDGNSQQADAIVFATGYMNSESSIQALMGNDMAKKCHERWEKGNAFFLGPEGESIINYCPLPQKGLYSMFHQFSFSRFHSARLALRIKAQELGIDVTPYGGKPLGPPSTAAGRKPRPVGVPL